VSRPAGAFVRYVVVGVVNTAVTYALYLALLQVMDYGWAYTIAFVAGIGIAYALQSRFVFGAAPSLKTFFAFPLVYVVQYVVGGIALRVLVESGIASREIALFLVLAVTVPVGYVLSKALFAWRHRGDHPPA
jgi:putative flippase GtrA